MIAVKNVTLQFMGVKSHKFWLFCIFMAFHGGCQLGHYSNFTSFYGSVVLITAFYGFAVVINGLNFRQTVKHRS
jgi:hypothetical protein